MIFTRKFSFYVDLVLINTKELSKYTRPGFSMTVKMPTTGVFVNFTD